MDKNKQLVQPDLSTTEKLKKVSGFDQVKLSKRKIPEAIGQSQWYTEIERLSQRHPADFVAELRRMASGIDMSRYRKSVRGPKKTPPNRTNKRNSVHVSTKRILDKRKEK